MKTILKSTAAAVTLSAAAFFGSGSASADSWSIGFDSRGVIGFSYQTGGYCDRWGCPGEFWNYPVYYCPVFYDGWWFRGPVYYRVYYGRPFFWVHGGWHEDEWDGPRPYWACTDRFGPPLDYDDYEELGFVWRDAWIYDWWWANRDFYPGYDFNWWRYHHRDWDRGHDFDDWRERRMGGSDWFRRHGFDANWQQRVHRDQNWQRGWRPNPAWTKPNPEIGNMKGFRPNEGNGPRGPSNGRDFMEGRGDHDRGRPHDNFAPEAGPSGEHDRGRHNNAFAPENGPSGDQHDWGQSRGRHQNDVGGPEGNAPNSAGPNGPFGGEQRDWHADRHVRGNWQEGPSGDGAGGPGAGPENRQMMDTHQGGPPSPPPQPQFEGGPPHERGNGGGNNGGQGNGGGNHGNEGDRGHHHGDNGGGP